MEVRCHHRARSDLAALADRHVFGSEDIQTVHVTTAADADGGRRPYRVDGVVPGTIAEDTVFADDDATRTVQTKPSTNLHSSADRHLFGGHYVESVDVAPVADVHAPRSVEKEKAANVHLSPDGHIFVGGDVQAVDVAPAAQPDGYGTLAGVDRVVRRATAQNAIVFDDDPTRSA
jgi:hypothetical protein